MKDLFECPELLPENVQTIISRFNDLEIERGVQYSDLIQMGKEMAENGYSFDFYLDGIPYNLKKNKVMKEIKLKSLWAIDIDNIQWETFKYKREAINYIIFCRLRGIKGNPTMTKRKVLTDKY